MIFWDIVNVLSNIKCCKYCKDCVPFFCICVKTQRKAIQGAGMRRMWRLKRKKQCDTPSTVTNCPPLSYSIHLCCHIHSLTHFKDFITDVKVIHLICFRIIKRLGLLWKFDYRAYILRHLFCCKHKMCHSVLEPSHSDLTCTSRCFGAPGGGSEILMPACPMASWVWQCMMEKPIGCLGSWLSVSQAYPWSGPPCPWDAPSVI